MVECIKNVFISNGNNDLKLVDICFEDKILCDYQHVKENFIQSEPLIILAGWFAMSHPGRVDDIASAAIALIAPRSLQGSGKRVRSQ